MTHVASRLFAEYGSTYKSTRCTWCVTLLCVDYKSVLCSFIHTKQILAPRKPTSLFVLLKTVGRSGTRVHPFADRCKRIGKDKSRGKPTFQATPDDGEFLQTRRGDAFIRGSRVHLVIPIVGTFVWVYVSPKHYCTTAQHAVCCRMLFIVPVGARLLYPRYYREQQQ